MRTTKYINIALAMFYSFTGFAFDPDHYISYDIKTTSSTSHKIRLKDQFIDWTNFRVRNAIKLLNPTLKRHNNQVFEIKNPRLHYTAYKLDYRQAITINKHVEVTNQFGTFKLETFRPDRLLTPSLKRNLSLLASQEARPPQADHYLCYEIPPVTITTDFGFLRDQFRRRSFENTLIATRFCNPVAKIHDNRTYPILNDDEANHLMCFQLERERLFRIVAILNQFGVKKALVTRDDELCVPSVKRDVVIECLGSLPDEDGICNGLCPNPNDVCRPSATNNECTCVQDPVELCIDSIPDPDGVCGGLCVDPNDSCLPSTTGDFCSCVPQVDFPCSLNADGQCGGFCQDPAQVCTIIPGSTNCACILQY
jgi:hypothetical protein